MHLLIDWGNTRLKAILVESLDSFVNQPSKSTAVSLETSSALLEWLSFERKVSKLSGVLIASVRKDKETEQLLTKLEPINTNYFIAETTESSAGVRCAYKEPSKLGVDRWLGVIAGYTKHHTTAVIDIGSAITVDVVNAKGNHLGGHIIPGEQLIKSSLKQTGKVFAETLEYKQQEFQLGTTTGECVDFGIQQLIQGYLTSTIFELARQYQVSKWLFTGGGGRFWKQRLAFVDNFVTDENSKFLPNIVFSGLVIDFLEKTDRAQPTRD